MEEEETDAAADANDALVQKVHEVFPDICPIYLDRVTAVYGYNANSIISFIMDQEEAGRPYQREPPKKPRKRKRDAERELEAEVTRIKRKYTNPERLLQPPSQERFYKLTRMLHLDFPTSSEAIVQHTLAANNQLLLPTYVALYEMIRQPSQSGQQWRLRENPRDPSCHNQGNISKFLQMTQSNLGPADVEMLEEFEAARLICLARDRQRRAHSAQEQAEKKNYEEAMINGHLAECQCCFADFPINRLVHCNGDPLHFFCRNCARRNAESVVGLSRHELYCMSTDECKAGFSREERGKFLDEKLVKALDRIEQEAVLRIAGLADLVTCPFCPYAAEYPPIEQDKEFRCLNSECQTVSCRHCKSKTHIPMSCEESARETGYSGRRKIEEAMSAALIRKCNKCSTPFIKTNGCNKVVCSRMECQNVQCYVCSKSCGGYSHFNDPERGGQTGNCPLFDDVEIRHNHEVQKAEASERERVTLENPEIQAEFLRFNMSEAVIKQYPQPGQHEYQRQLTLGQYAQHPPLVPMIQRDEPLPLQNGQLQGIRIPYLENNPMDLRLQRIRREGGAIPVGGDMANGLQPAQLQPQTAAQKRAALYAQRDAAGHAQRVAAERAQEADAQRAAALHAQMEAAQHAQAQMANMPMIPLFHHNQHQAGPGWPIAANPMQGPNLANGLPNHHGSYLHRAALARALAAAAAARENAEQEAARAREQILRVRVREEAIIQNFIRSRTLAMDAQAAAVFAQLNAGNAAVDAVPRRTRAKSKAAKKV